MDIIKSEPDSDNEIDPLSSHCEFQLVNIKYEDQSEETTFHTPRSESRSSMDIKKEEHDSDTEAHCISSCSEDQLTDMKQEEFLVPVPIPALESETNDDLRQFTATKEDFKNELSVDDGVFVSNMDKVITQQEDSEESAGSSLLNIDTSTQKLQGYNEASDLNEVLNEEQGNNLNDKNAEERRYKCGTCYSCYSTFQELARHRRTHIREKQFKCEVKESKRTGAGTQEVYSPRLWNFDYFTDDKVFIRSGTDTLDGTDEEDGNESVVSTRTETQHFQTPQSRKGHTTFRRNQEQILEATQSLLSSKEDEWEIIGKSIGLQLKDLTKYQQTIANKLISDIIFYGKVNKLTECSSIILSTVIHTPSPSYPTTHHPTIPSKSLQSSQATHIQVHIPEDDNDLSVIQ